ncbi:hypothetical protein [Mycobacterium sp. 94-17]|uniref:hypothetical protein n=1 Tax=Mycobacterium sp. 94-17 TaxID=2986147 RepID=UPI002D1E5DFB|nr:hypothetical protein [Mycobacterium sp. 94-17]MEB4211722.1 hypothetical protein [Mycobacterium sp. 94-17]
MSFEIQYASLTFSELVQVLEECELLLGWLAALEYELRGPFSRPSGRRTWR